MGIGKAYGWIIGISVFASAVLLGALVYKYHVLPNALPDGFDSMTGDMDRDGRADYLLVRSRIEVPISGTYSVEADLTAGTDSITATRGTVTLAKGPTVVSVGFLGGPIQAAGDRDLVASIRVRDAAGTLVASNSHALPTRPASLFEAPDGAVVFSSAPAASPRDSNADGVYEDLTVTIPVRINRAAYYQSRADVVGGLPAGAANGPRWQVESYYNDPQHLSEGTHTITKTLNGQDLFAAGLRGGFDVRVEVFTTPGGHYCYGDEGSESSLPPESGARLGLVAPYLMPERPLDLSASATVHVALDYDAFTPLWLPADFTGVIEDATADRDGNGLADGLLVNAEVNVNQRGTFDLSGTLFARGTQDMNSVDGTRSTTYVGGAVVSTTWARLFLQPGTQTVSLTFPGSEIVAAGINGPYEAKLRLVPAEVVIDPVIVHVTATYTVDQFEASGAKSATVTALEADLAGGVVTVSVEPGANLLLRIIHENGIVVYESGQVGGSWTDGATTFRVSVETPGEYAVAAYVLVNGVPEDYRELVLTR